MLQFPALTRSTPRIMLALVLAGLAAIAFGAPTQPPTSGPAANPEIKPISGVIGGDELVFQTFARSATTPTSIQFGAELDIKYTTKISATGSNRVRAAVSAGSCTPFEPDDYLGNDGVGYLRAVFEVDGVTRGVHTNWKPVGALGSPGTGEGNNSTTLIQDDDETLAWTDEITDPSLLAFVTGSGSFRIYYQFSYNTSDLCTIGGGVSVSKSVEITPLGGVQYNY